MRVGLSSNWLGRGLLNMAVGRCAQLIATYLDGFGDPTRAVSPQQLEEAAATNQPLLMEAVSAVSPENLAMVRSSFGNLAGDFSRDHPGLGHPYMWVLQDDRLSRDKAAHVQVILRHPGWYRQQMDQAVQLLFGSEK